MDCNYKAKDNQIVTLCSRKRKLFLSCEARRILHLHLRGIHMDWPCKFPKAKPELRGAESRGNLTEVQRNWQKIEIILIQPDVVIDKIITSEPMCLIRFLMACSLSSFEKRSLYFMHCCIRKDSEDIYAHSLVTSRLS